MFRIGGPPRRAVKHRGLGRKSGVQKAKTPAGMLAFLGLGDILPKSHYTLGDTFCQAKTRISVQAVGAGAEEIEEAEITEDLELLADFVADVDVFGMESCQCVGVRVDVGESEFEFA